MGKSLVIVESPAKAKTINKFLGDKYVVKASMGHVRDLPKDSFGVDVEKEFSPKYRTIKGRQKLIDELRKLAKSADAVFLAVDPDREGEAIAWHLAEVIKVPEDKIHRVTFNEITKKAIQAAFASPGKLDMQKVNAQQARRILDRIVGYKLSPLLWKKITKRLSAGRVQSVAVRLIVEREKEIAKFKPEEYWKIPAKFKTKENTEFDAELAKWDGKDIDIKSKEQADEILKILESGQFVIAEINVTEQKSSAKPPFITSTLQQQAASRLNFTASKTMEVAQKLYEGINVGEEGSVGLITYMRTDSFRVSSEAMDEVREYIKNNYDGEYLPEKPNFYASKKRAQGAHEAIRPTFTNLTPEKISQYLTPEQNKLYKIIWERFVSSQMTPARYRLTTAEITCDKALFRARGRELLFPGHTIFTSAERDLVPLPSLEKGHVFDMPEITSTQHFTKPPARYTEASIVKTLEKEGIGRPSTYASIIGNVTERGYVERLKESGRPFMATELGILVTDKLIKHFPDILNVEFTASVEDELDKIEDSQKEWKDVIGGFYTPFEKDLESAFENMTTAKGIIEDGEKCPECDKDLVIRWSKTGKFLGCSGFPKCKYTKRIGQEDETPSVQPTDKVCDKCGQPMVIRQGKRGEFMACSAYPKCRNTLSMDGKTPEKPATTEYKCEKCNSAMVIRQSRRGKFIACSGFPKCKNAKPLPDELRDQLKKKPKE